MASGILGSADLIAATNNVIYTVPATKTASISVNVCNRGSVSAKIRVAVASSGSPTNKDYIIYDAGIAPGESLERSGMVVDENKLVVVYSSVASVSAQVYGYEEIV